MSWTQTEPATSLSLIAEACPAGQVPVAKVIDVGGGTSLLCERLLDRGYSVAVPDISAVALDRARKRLGLHAGSVQWIVGDVLARPALQTFDVWHDRAVFYFLTAPGDRAAYVESLARTVPPGSHAVIATFDRNGPEKCSGLPVQRYDERALSAELSPYFECVKSVPEMHHTPTGARQSFLYCLFKRVGAQTGSQASPHS